MPTVPGGIAPPAKPLSHAKSVVVAGGPNGEHMAVCHFPDCGWHGQDHKSWFDADAEGKAHTG